MAVKTENYLVKIQGSKGVSCLGIQLLDILIVLSDYTKDLTWYAADVDAVGYLATRLNLQAPLPQLIGTLRRMMQLSLAVDQFYSGVFFATTLSCDVAPTTELYTEDEEFRKIANSILEIRAFDTSFFEIYTSDKNIVTALVKRYSEKDFDAIESFPIKIQIPKTWKKDRAITERQYPIRAGEAAKLTILEEKKDYAIIVYEMIITHENEIKQDMLQIAQEALHGKLHLITVCNIISELSLDITRSENDI